MRGNRNVGDAQAAGAEVKPKIPMSVMIYFSEHFHRALFSSFKKPGNPFFYPPDD
jgi:hypothetical protein